MDKNINDNDRIIIGVREWALQTVLGDKWVGRNLVEEAKETGNTKAIVETATELEGYVLGDMGEATWSYLQSHTHVCTKEDERRLNKSKETKD